MEQCHFEEETRHYRPLRAPPPYGAQNSKARTRMSDREKILSVTPPLPKFDTLLIKTPILLLYVV